MDSLDVGNPATIEYPKSKASEAMVELTHSLILGRKRPSSKSGLLAFSSKH